jgi:uncharacterized membrane protein YfcA
MLLALLVWLGWYTLGGGNYLFQNIIENWEVALTMVFGSFIAGATSEGGGAVAFPVFTKVLGVAPQDAKVFSLAIQSVGMTAASLVIIIMRVQVEWRVILLASLGGIPGIIVGSTFLAPVLPPALIKMSFTVMVTSFAVTLFALNRGIRDCNTRLPDSGTKVQVLLLITGFIGGTMSGLVGNGIDIITFSVMVLLFRISEKVATPTSVILMAINAFAGFMLHAFHLGGFNEQVQAYWLACIPIVVIGAPLGAMVCSMLDRVVIARILISLILIELISSLLIIQFTSMIAIASITVLITFSFLYYLMLRTRVYEPETNCHIDQNR